MAGDGARSFEPPPASHWTQSVGAVRAFATSRICAPSCHTVMCPVASAALR